MKKALVLLSILIALSSVVFANGSSESATSDKVYTIKIGHEFTTESPRHKGLEAFKSYVDANSNGRIKIEFYPAGVLGKEAEMQESMKMGNLEGFVGGPFDTITPKLNLFLMPFFFEDQDALMRVAKSEIGDVIIKDAEKNGLKILAIGNGGNRQITNNVREIKTPADMKGLKIRTPGMVSIIECMKALGANPVSIPYADTYMALKTGVADGQENPFANIGDMKFYEVQKYLTYIDYQFHPEVFTMNLKFFNSLPEDLQKIVQDGAWIFADTVNSIRADMDKGYIKTIEDYGTKIYKPTPAEKQAFMEACAPVYKYFVDNGTFTQEELDAVRRISQGK
jgi:tripartite ATP-independent periplasmic transporter solute receptor, DctP family